MKLKMNTLLIENEGPKGLFKRLRKDDDGSIIIFSLFMFIMILWFGGMAVDLMRFETTRAKLQATLDRATLAAADLDQTMAPADVVRDYLAKADMLQFLIGDPIVTQGVNFRVVTANAKAEMPLFFYDLPRIFTSPFTAGLSTLTVSGASTAEERVSDVEVSLVLDVSGSMDDNDRMTHLRPAARQFVTTVLSNNTNAPQGLITISMIPYSAVVNPGTLIEPYLPIERSHMYSACLLLDDTTFLTTALDLNPADDYDHVAHFDTGWTWYDDPFKPFCPTENDNAIMPFTSNEGALHIAINGLTAYGNTAIDMGVKWGVALLDPSTQSIVTGLAGVTSTGVPAAAAGRPVDFTQTDVLKVLVLMTDGQNTTVHDLKPHYKHELSFVWANLNSPTANVPGLDLDETSVQTNGLSTPTSYSDDRFFWNDDESFRNYPRGYSSQSEYIDARVAGTIVTAAPGVGATYADNVRQTKWQELFASFDEHLVNNNYLWEAYNDSDGDGSGDVQRIPYYSSNPVYANYKEADDAVDESVINGTQANARLSDICAAARAEGIVIYTVAFEAPTNGREALLDCATSPSHYFDVAGTDISVAFEAIALDIRNLKLTQ